MGEVTARAHQQSNPQLKKQSQTKLDAPTYFEVYRILQITNVHPAIAFFNLLIGSKRRKSLATVLKIKKSQIPLQFE